MKQKDIALIVAVMFFSAILSLVLARFLFQTPENRQQQVEVVPSISAQFQTPDTKYFNSNSVDPTQLIQIGDNNNTNPFNGTQQ